MILPLSLFAQGGATTTFDKYLYISGNQTLPYRLLKPQKLEAEKKYPLIIFFHGAGERGTDNEIHIKHITETFLNAENREKFPCFIIAPQCPENTMWASHDREGKMKASPSPVMQMVIALIEKTQNEFPIDLSRVYVTGLSMGGYGTWDLIARFPGRFAAAVPICGGGDQATAAIVQHIPIWAFHGSRDTVVLPQNSRKMIRAIQTAGGKPGYTEYPDVGHDSWVEAYREPYLLPWLFRQHLKKTSDGN